jgi:hypothetical protein
MGWKDEKEVGKIVLDAFIILLEPPSKKWSETSKYKASIC